MKTKILDLGLLIISALLTISAIANFIMGNFFSGLCNILWAICCLACFWTSKYADKRVDAVNRLLDFMEEVDRITSKGAAAIIVKREKSFDLFPGELVNDEVGNTPSCSAENNDQIAYCTIAENTGDSHE